MTGSPTRDEIRALLSKHHLTQQNAAALVFGSRKAMVEWLSGRRNMPRAKWELMKTKVSAPSAPVAVELDRKAESPRSG